MCTVSHFDENADCCLPLSVAVLLLEMADESGDVVALSDVICG